MKIVVTDHLFGQVEQEKAIAESFGHTLEEHQCIDEHETSNAVTNANIVFNNLAPINKSALQNMAKDAVVIRYGVGIYNVDSLLGFGRIAQAVATRLLAFGYRIIACDPYADIHKAEKLGVTIVELDTLYQQSTNTRTVIPSNN